jgi:hypothetical protein
VISAYKSESDLRRELRGDKLIGPRLRWIEPAFGSTIGLPDCFMPYGDIGSGRVLWLELKLGVRERKRSKTFVDGRMVDGLRYSVRKQQRVELLKMAEEGLRVGLLVAEAGTKRVWALQKGAIWGDFCELEGPQGWAKQVPLLADGGKDWRLGFNWIFFDNLQ